MNKATLPPPPKAAKGNGSPSAAPAPSKDRPRLGSGKAEFKPPRIVLNAVEGWGKTSLGAFAPNPAILMAAGETGYETLLGAGLVPNVPRAKLETWPDTLALLDDLIQDDTGTETVVLDAVGGFERMCHEYVCNRDFNGDWGERGFTSYQKGYEVAVADWLQLLQKLERLQEFRGATVVILSHCRVKTFKNPMGADYDRWVSDCHDKTWSITHKWADAVLFGNFFTVVEGGKTGEKPKKGKGIGGTQRVIYTERRDAFDAKNRYGMSEVLDIPNDASRSWPTVWSAIRKEN